MTKKILLIEDDESIRELVEVNIRYLGYDVDYAADGEAGLELALANEYALVILDLNLPKLGGMEVCQQLRRKKELTPVIMLSARSSELDRVLGLELGADDYLTKPFSVPELMARIKVRLKHSSREGGGASRTDNPVVSAKPSGTSIEQVELILCGDLVVDAVKRKVLLRGEAVVLTAKEFDVLLFLMQHPGRPFTRDELLSSVWGLSAYGYENNVNGLITRLRRKIEENPSEPRYLKTVWGIGYRFVEAEELAHDAEVGSKEEPSGEK